MSSRQQRPQIQEASESDPSSATFRSVFRDLEQRDQAEYLLMRQANNATFRACTPQEIASLIPPSYIEATLEILGCPDIPHADDGFENYSFRVGWSNPNDNLRYRILAAGESDSAVHFVLCLFNDNDEMVLLLGNNEGVSKVAESKNDLCCYVCSVDKNTPRPILCIDSVMSPDLGEREMLRLSDGNFNGMFSRFLESKLATINKHAPLRELLVANRMSNQSGDPALATRFGVATADNSFISFVLNCTSEMSWRFSHICDFFSNARIGLRSLFSASVPNNSLDQYISRLGVDPITPSQMLVNPSTLGSTIAAYISGLDETALKMVIDKTCEVRTARVRLTPSETNSASGQRLISNEMAAFSFKDTSGRYVFPVKGGAANFGKHRCGMIVHVLEYSNEAGVHFTQYKITAVILPVAALALELRRLIDNREDSILRQQLINVISAADGRFAAAEEAIKPKIKNIRVGTYPNEQGLPFVTFCVEHQLGVTVLAMKRHGQSDVIRFDYKDWPILNVLDHFKRELPKQNWD